MLTIPEKWFWIAPSENINPFATFACINIFIDIYIELFNLTEFRMQYNVVLEMVGLG